MNTEAGDRTVPRFLTIGEVVGTWGIRGEIKVLIVTQFPDRFAGLTKVYLNESPFEVESCRFHRRLVILKLRGVESIEEAEKLRGSLAEVPLSEAVPLAEEHYYHYQIIGLDVWTKAGRHIGKVVEILTPQSNDVYVVRSEDREFLIPAVEDVVLEIDLQRGRITIEPLPGLLD